MNRKYSIFTSYVMSFMAMIIIVPFPAFGIPLEFVLPPQLRVEENGLGQIRDITLGGDAQTLPLIAFGLETNLGPARAGGGIWCCKPVFINGELVYLTAEEAAGTVRDVTPGGDVSSIPPFATGLDGPIGLVSPPTNDRLLIIEAFAGEVTEVTSGGDFSSAAPLISGFTFPEFGIFDSAGNLYISDAGAGTVFLVENPFDPLTQNVVAFATGLSLPAELFFISSGEFLISEFGAGEVTDISGGGDFSSSLPFATGLSGPAGIAVHPITNQIFVAEYDSGEVTDITGGGDFSGAVPFAFNLSRPDGLSFSLTTVPEPSTFILLGIGLVGMGIKAGLNYSGKIGFQFVTLRKQA